MINFVEKAKGLHTVGRRIKSLVTTSVIFLFLAVAPLRANVLPTKPRSPSLKSITEVLPQSFVGSTSVTRSVAVCLNGDSLSLWRDSDDTDKDKDKKNDDTDDRVPEPGVILQLALGLLGVASLRLVFKPQESNPR